MHSGIRTPSQYHALAIKMYNTLNMRDIPPFQGKEEKSAFHKAPIWLVGGIWNGLLPLVNCQSIPIGSHAFSKLFCTEI